MFEILRKTFIIEAFGKKIEYKQFTLFECLEFSYNLQNKAFTLEDFCAQFIADHSELNTKEIQGIDINVFLGVLKDTAFRGYFAKSVGGHSMPFEAYLVSLSDKLKLDPNKILMEYTPEQISFYTDGIVYNLNEQSKEGRRRNIVNQQMKKLRENSDAEKDLEEIKEMEKKLALNKK